MTGYENLSETSFNEKLERQWEKGKFACVGLDPNIEKILEYYPEFTLHNNDAYAAITNFNRLVIDQTIDVAAAYKLDPGFYYPHLGGETAMVQTVREIQMKDPNVPIIIDGKYGGTQFANKGYAEYVFGKLGADAVTVRYVGKEALEPFTSFSEKGIFVVVRTSDVGSDEVELQKTTELCGFGRFQPAFVANTYDVVKRWNQNGNCGLVVAATHPEDLNKVRSMAPDMPILVPAIGAQGGSAESAMTSGQNSYGTGILGSASRSVSYPNVPNGFTHAETVRGSLLQLHNELKHRSTMRESIEWHQ